MAWKKLTFILIPHSQSNVKQVSVPRVYVYGAIAGLVIAIGIMIFYILGFEGKSYYDNLTTEIKAQNEILERQVAFLDSSFTTVDTEIDSLKKLNDEIGTTYNITSQNGSDDRRWDMYDGDGNIQIPLDRIVGMVGSIEKATFMLDYNFNNVCDKCLTNEDLLRHVPSIRPAMGTITKKFGVSRDEYTNTVRKYPGVNINNVEGTPIVATADGIVEKIGFSNELGRYIIIDHGNGYKTWYTHLQNLKQMKDKIDIKKGTTVTRGQQIGSMGRTGMASILQVAPHIMYTVEHDGVPVNPEDYFFAYDFAAEEGNAQEQM